VGSNVEGVNEGMERVRMKVVGIDDQLQGVGHQVGLINKGDLFLPAPNASSALLG
jgi:hypothetical protein